jgi:NADH-quinone oxidoreductase subunit L
MSGEQDMMKMGSLRKKTPITFWTMFIGTLAIAGIPGLAGFFSKDEILWKAFSSGHGSPFLWAVAAVAAGTTAFYMFRLIFLTFFGASRIDKEVEKHVHESPFSMTIPLMVLAALSICGGWIGIPAALGGANHFEHWLAPIFEGGQHAVAAAANAAAHGGAEAAHGAAHHDPMEFILMGASVAVALFGIALAYYLYILRPEKPAEIAAENPNLYRTVYNKYFVDELYEWLIVRRIVNWSVWLWQAFDAAFIDGMVNGVASVVRNAGDETRKVQTGVVGNYAFSILLGAVFIIGYLVLR